MRHTGSEVVSDLQGDKRGVDGGISMNVGSFEPDLFEHRCGDERSGLIKALLR